MKSFLENDVFYMKEKAYELSQEIDTLQRFFVSQDDAIERLLLLNQIKINRKEISVINKIIREKTIK